MAPPADAISVKFENLQELRTAIQQAQLALQENREAWMGFTTGAMSTAWADAGGQANQDRNVTFSQYGQDNEEFLANLMKAVDAAEAELRAAVQRGKAAIMAR
jgi:uroporphyrinogen-III decarboxylase